MKKIAVLGAGTMGAGIAQVIATNGYKVILRDIKEEYLEKGMASIKKSLERSVEKERLTEEERKEILERLETTTKLKDLSDVDLVIEAIVEDLEIKKEVFAELDEVCKTNTIFATNTSALSVTELATITKRPDQVLGVHFFNPVSVMQLVELIKNITTSDEVFAQVEEFIQDIGKDPIEVEEAPGFVVNRLLIPMINEAIYLFQEGVASREDIDKAMKLGANHPLGPLALADLIGLDICLAIMETLHEEFGEPKYRPCPLLRKKVRAGQLGRKASKGFYDYS